MFENVTLNTKRPGFIPSTNQTTGSDVYLQGVVVNLRPMTQKDYNGLPQAALVANYIVTLTPAMNPGKTDIANGDTLVNAIRIVDGLPFDDDVPPAGQANSAVVIWHVKYAPPTRLGPLTHKVIYVLREVLSGPAHP